MHVAQMILLPSVPLGNGATIGAGSIVTRNSQPHAIVTGNPPQVVHMRNDGALRNESAPDPDQEAN